MKKEQILEILMQKSRDNSRTPMQWDDSENAGFTTGKPWIGIPENYKEINTKAALKDKNSVFYHYQKLIKLRKSEDLFVIGKYEDIDLENKEVYAYRRVGENGELIVISNFYENEVKFDINGLEIEKCKVLLSNYKENPKVEENEIVLKPYESIIFKK